MSLIPQTAMARESGGVSFHYPQLTAMNYTTWAIKVEALLDAQGLWEAVAPEVGVEVDARKDKTARACLLQMLPEDILLQVANKMTAKGLWDCLKTRFVGADRVKTARLQTLKSDFDALRMEDGEKLDVYAGKISGMSVKFANLGGTLDDAAMVKKFLNTVPERFYPVIAGIEQFCDLETMAFEEAVGRLKTFEERARLRAPSGQGDSQLLLTQAEWESRQRRNGSNPSPLSKFKNLSLAKSSTRSLEGRGRGRGRRGGRDLLPKKEGSSASGGNLQNKNHIKCFNCNQMGHYAPDCRRKKDVEEANIAQTDEEEPELLLTQTCSSVPSSRELAQLHLQTGVEDVSSSDVWYFDNGASNHMSGERSKFRELDQSFQGHVKFGNGSTVKILGKGSILLRFKGGRQRLLKEVYYIPELRNNILSCGQLVEGGNQIVMRGEHLMLFDSSNKLLMRIKGSSNRLYKANIPTDESVCLLTSTMDEAWLWHYRLGHVS